MNTRNNIYFNLKDHQYYFGEDAFSSETNSDYDIIPIDQCAYQPLDDGGVAALVFVERDEKKGVMTIHKCGQGGYGGVLYSSNMFPLLYDEMLLNGGFEGNGIGYAAVRINHYWGVLRVESIGLPQEKRSKSGKKCIMIIPCMYQTKEEAIKRILSRDFHPEYGWRDPFSEKAAIDEEQKDEVPVVITYSFNWEEIADGRDEILCWVTEEEYKKIQEYYAHPYAHYIGVMINFELPRIKKMVQDHVCDNVENIFIEDIRKANEGDLLFEDDEESDELEQSNISNKDNEPLPF